MFEPSIPKTLVVFDGLLTMVFQVLVVQEAGSGSSWRAGHQNMHNEKLKVIIISFISKLVTSQEDD